MLEEEGLAALRQVGEFGQPWLWLDQQAVDLAVLWSLA